MGNCCLSVDTKENEESDNFDDLVEKRLNEWKVEKLSSPYLDTIPQQRMVQQRKIIEEQIRNEKTPKSVAKIHDGDKKF